MKYEVVIHYEGGWLFEITAKTEEQAKNIAEERFIKIPPQALIDNLAHVFVCDCREVKNN